MESRRILLAALACGSLLISACGGGGDSGGGSDVDAAAQAPSTIPSEQADAIEQASLLRLVDMPAGWTEVPPATEEEILHFPGDECAEFEEFFNSTIMGPEVNFESPAVFDQSIAVSQMVAVTDADTAAWAKGALGLPNAVDCFEAALADELGDVEFRSSRPSLDPAQAAGALDIFITVPSDADPPLQYKYAVRIAVTGNVVSQLSVLSSNYLPFDAATLESKIATRMAAATTTAPATDAPAVTLAPEEAQALARRALLALENVPSGWRNPGPSFRTVLFPGDECAAFETNLNSPTNGVQVDLEGREVAGRRSSVSQVVSVADPATATWASTAMGQASAEHCVAAALQKWFAHLGFNDAVVIYGPAAADVPANSLTAKVAVTLPDGSPFTYDAVVAVSVVGRAVSITTVLSTPDAPVIAAPILTDAAEKLALIG
jgi:hypothetical protein